MGIAEFLFGRNVLGFQAGARGATAITDEASASGRGVRVTWGLRFRVWGFGGTRPEVGD